MGKSNKYLGAAVNAACHRFGSLGLDGILHSLVYALLRFSGNINRFNLIVLPIMFPRRFNVFTFLCTSFLATMLSLLYDRAKTTFVCCLQEERLREMSLSLTAQLHARAHTHTHAYTHTHTQTHTQISDVGTLCRRFT